MNVERRLRIAVVSWSRRSVGGLEAFVGQLLTELHSRGHEVGFWTEMDLPANRPRIALPPGTASWSVEELGLARALDELRAWAPDVISTHGIVDPRIEQSTLAIAPATFFAHAYSGTCISGLKAFSFPETRPCRKEFSWTCMLYYYPRRCGGLNPVSMAREYTRQNRRFQLMHGYRRIFTRSTHMREEYLRHGFPPEQLEVVEHELVAHAAHADEQMIAPTHPAPTGGGPLRLLFLGRMDRLKGGRLLLKALPRLATPDRPVRLVFAGDGPDRANWEQRARHIMATTEGVEVVFAGWVEGARRGELLENSDLLMIPSLWPEPFGLVGREAGLHGVPSVGFAVGGIPDWLEDGVNGCLAPGEPPTVEGLVAATNRAIGDAATYQRLSRGAMHHARSFDAHQGVETVADVLETLACDPNA
jgi:glycosyltransferase involved in cell wall biosynthesis